jgi:glycosyltransferase involved in cell wall biosynthesis
MKVLLFDLSTTGHHAFWVSCIARHLCANGHEVHFMTLKYDDNLTISVNQPNFRQFAISNNPNAIIETNFFKRNYQMIASLKRCMRYANSWKADIVHVLYMDHNVIPIFLLNLTRKFRKLSQFVGLLFWPYFVEEVAVNHNTSKMIYRALNRLLLRKLLISNNLAALFVLTSNIREYIIKSLKLSQPYTDRIIPIPDPVLMFVDICSPNEARRRLNLPKDSTILLFFGVLSKDKGFDLLLEAIRNSEKRFTLLVAGRGTAFDLAFIENFRQHCSSSVDIVTRIEHIPDSEVPYYFLSADATVLPYRKSYIGMSGVLQQSCGAGKPVIASDVGEIGAMVKQYNLGILGQPESISSLKKVIDQFLARDKQAEERFRENVLNYAHNHHWKVMVAKVEQVYSQILRGELI